MTPLPQGRTLVISIGICVLLGACSGRTITRIGEPPPLPVSKRALQVRVTPADSTIDVDGSYFGAVNRYRDGWMAISAKHRRVKIHKSGYYAWYGLLPKGLDPVRLKMRLVPIPTVQSK
jgi:hypothetical protein